MDGELVRMLDAAWWVSGTSRGGLRYITGDSPGALRLTPVIGLPATRAEGSKDTGKPTTGVAISIPPGSR